MHKGRLEAFSDGVIAILITIMVLEMKAPHDVHFAALLPVLPIFFCYVLSFVYIAIYWNNHHHLMQAAKKVNGRVLWANMHLLFWLSLIPFTTSWLGENHFDSAPVALYGVVLFACGASYYILVRSLLKHHGRDSELASALGNALKDKISVAAYLIAILVAFFMPIVSCIIYILVAIFWLIPDRRIENRINDHA